DKAALEAARDELNAANFAKARIGPSIVRVYAHQHKATDNRADFAPTIYWNPQLQTNAQGEASASFDTSDAVTTWLVQADAHALAGSGRVGQAETKFTARLPFHLECKLPDELSAGDTLSLPVAAIVEGSTIPAVDLRVQLGGGLRLSGEVPQRIDLVNGRGRALVPVAAEQGATTATLSIEGRAGRFTDRVSHTLRIVPRGFQHKRSAGGTVAAGTPAELALAIPQDAVPGSGRVTLKLFPSPLAALTEGLQGILQEPHGCFEQASSSNYPNTLVLALLEASGDNVPTVAARARALLPRGYAKITGYECKERGYEWFGGDPGHEALTAYGLLQFHDMAKVHPVDAAMVERTRTWLLGRRDGKGGYQRNSRALDSFGRAPQPVTDAYVTYALLVGGVTATELQKELDALLARAPATEDPYELALIACALQLAQRNEPAAAARTRLAGMQQENGSLRGTTSSITSSGGQDLIVESTGFAVLAWLPDPACQGQLRRAVQFLQGARGASGTFGATQATIVALRALTEYAQANRAMKAPGTLRVFAGERLLLEKGFAAGAVDALALELWNLLPPGAHALRLELEGGGGTLPWACDVAYHSEQPADDPAAKVALRASLRAGSVREGETVALDVEVENRTAEGLPMTMAIVGLPAGLELPTRVLEDLQKAQRFAFWELRGRELALYWRDFEPEGKRTLTLDLMARVPGRSTGPASRGYL
ncbi:MAG: A-macroglobulin complement component, partial [Planctomycetes bacterium]|nr:A-macroglobulin complement component [Planctomycetota bacterium]